MENWDGIKDEELDKVGACSSRRDYIKSMKELQEAHERMLNSVEIQRVKAGNAIMNWLTDYFLEQKQFYKERYRENWENSIIEDIDYLTENKELNMLLKKYCEWLIGE